MGHELGTGRKARKGSAKCAKNGKGTSSLTLFAFLSVLRALVHLKSGRKVRKGRFDSKLTIISLSPFHDLNFRISGFGFRISQLHSLHVKKTASLPDKLTFVFKTNFRHPFSGPIRIPQVSESVSPCKMRFV